MNAPEILNAENPAQRNFNAETRRAAEFRRVFFSAVLCVFALISLLPVQVAAATNDLTSLLQRGLFEEEAKRDLDAAIASYESLAKQFDKNRQVAATAIFRLGECYRKLGKTNEARLQYERIVSEFSDQPALANLSRQNLAGMGIDLASNSKIPMLIADQSESSSSVGSKLEEIKIRNIETMIQNSPDLINSGTGGMTPLYDAANKGYLRVATFLLDHGADVNFVNAGEVALHGAVRSGNRAMVKLLLDRGADVNAPDSTGGTSLHLATEWGFRSVAEVLIAHKADLEARNSPANGEATPLHRAASLGRTEMLKLLINSGADVNATTGGGLTALSLAAESQRLETVRQLLEAKADPNGGSVNPPLFWAIKHGDTNLLKILLSAGADVEEPQRLNRTVIPKQYQGVDILTNRPLKFALLHFPEDRTAVVKLLLQYKANPNATDASGDPLIFTGMRSYENLKALLEAGADPNVRSIHNEDTPLTVAALIAYGVSPSLGGKDLKTSWTGDFEATKLLIEHGAKVDVGDTEGNSPLHRAVQAGNREIVEFLLANKAAVNLRNKAGLTPLDIAKKSASPLPGDGWVPRPILQPGSKPQEYAEIAALLRQHGALDDLPDFTAIRFTRQGLDRLIPVFQENTNGFNHFTLSEALLRFYGTIARRVQLPGGSPHPESFSFPDLGRIIIHRPARTSEQKGTDIQINLLNGTNGIDCSKDVALEFGDVVEIPVREYRITEHAVGLTDQQEKELAACVNRTLTVKVRDQDKTLSLPPERSFLSEVGKRPEVLSMLLSSSDLSRVKVIRKADPTGPAREFVLNATVTDERQDLWLRDGDVIEVPEK